MVNKMPKSSSFSFKYKYILQVLILVMSHIWSFVESLLFVGGFIVCLMLPVLWPMKFVYAALWFVVFYICSKVIGVLEKYLAINKNSE